MTSNFEIINSSKFDLWNDILSNFNPTIKDIYFTPKYYQLYEKLENKSANCFIFKQNCDVAIYPFLTGSVNKLGYKLDSEYYDIEGAYGYNGIISNCYSAEFRNNFHHTFNRYCMDNNIIAEFTRFHPILNNHRFSESYLSIAKDRNTVFLDLSIPYKDIWDNQYSSNNRNMIRKAIKRGFTTNIFESPSNKKIEKFVEIYQNTMKAINADSYYLFNKDFFINIFEKLESYSAIVEVANSDDQIECMAIVLFYGNYSHYHLSGRIKNSDNSVNNLILDEAIKYSITKGAKYFHLGGGISSKNDDQLLKYKSNFSKGKGDFYIGKKIHNQEVYDQVISQWSTKYPDKTEKYKNHLLKYRY